MIRTKLRSLMEDRDLNIKLLNLATGISRTTLSNFLNDITKGIQFDTLNQLCQYLEVSPADFFEYVPFDMEFKVEVVLSNPDEDTPEAVGAKQSANEGVFSWPVYGRLLISEKDTSQIVQYSGYAMTSSAYDEDEPLDISLKISDDNADLVNSYFNQLSTAFQTDIKRRLATQVRASFLENVKHSNEFSMLFDYTYRVNITFTSAQKVRVNFLHSN